MVQLPPSYLHVHVDLSYAGSGGPSVYVGKKKGCTRSGNTFPRKFQLTGKLNYIRPPRQQIGEQMTYAHLSTTLSSNSEVSSDNTDLCLGYDDV